MRTVGLCSPAQLYVLNRAGRLTIKPGCSPIQKDEADLAIKQSLADELGLTLEQYLADLEAGLLEGSTED